MNFPMYISGLRIRFDMYTFKSKWHATFIAAGYIAKLIMYMHYLPKFDGELNSSQYIFYKIRTYFFAM